MTKLIQNNFVNLFCFCFFAFAKCESRNEIIELRSCESESGKYLGESQQKPASVTIPPKYTISKKDPQEFRISMNSPLNCDKRNKFQFFMTRGRENSSFEENLEINSNDTHKNTSETPLFNSDGYIYFEDRGYHPSKFCIDVSDQSPLGIGINSITFCQPECDSDICVNKCCPPGEVIDMSIHACSPSGNISWVPKLYTNNSNKIPRDQYIPMYYNVHLPNDCSQISTQDKQAYLISRHNRDLNTEYGTHAKSPFRLQTPGTHIMTFNERTKKWEEITSGVPFCVDGMQNFGESEFYSGTEEDDILIICENGYNTKTRDKREAVMYSTLLLLSAFFLLLTSIVQFLILEKKTSHGWTILCFLVSLFFTYSFLAVSQLLPLFFFNETGYYYLKSVPCVLLGGLTHFSLLSVFTWLTIFDFEIWKTFRYRKGLPKKSVSTSKRCIYALCGYGLPGLVLAIGFIMDINYKDVGKNETTKFFIPKYGQTNCYICKDALGLYVYGIIGCSLIFNSFFICSTATNIHSVRTGVRHFKRNSKQQSSFRLFTKLFLIMGVTWVLEIISWIHSEVSNLKIQPWYWTVSDIINILQPIGIFVIIVCKRKTIRQLKFKMNSVKSLLTSMPSFSRTSVFSSRSSSKRRASSRKESTATAIMVLQDIKCNGNFTGNNVQAI